jgi:hypothetical protein
MGTLPNGRINAVGFAYHGSIKDWISFVAMKLLQYNCKQFYMEDNADKGYSAEAIKLNPEVRREGIWVDDYHESTNKHVKIATYLYESWNLIEWARETDSSYMEMCVDYREKQEPDDAPDSAASLLREGGFSLTKDFMNSPIWDY